MDDRIVAKDRGGVVEVPERVVVSRGGIEPPTPCLEDHQTTGPRGNSATYFRAPDMGVEVYATWGAS